MKKLLLICFILTINLFSAQTSGKATFYHDKFEGRKTASGEIFDNDEFTAANRTIPFGTKVKITNLRNGKSVVVRINDRGPFTKGRAFDMSRAAFEEIGSLSAGHLPIEYEIVD